MIPRLQFFFPILLSSFLLLSGIMHLQGGGVDRMAYVGGNPLAWWFGLERWLLEKKWRHPWLAEKKKIMVL